jgi:multisubunit Na+/H+ antiporter MnhE subunit
MTKPKHLTSLLGSVAAALCVFAIWLLVAGSLAPGSIAIGLVLATAVGAWIRLANL